MSDASDRPELSVVIPCFNEEENVRAIHAAVAAELAGHAASHEIIFIDNGSTDATRALLGGLCAEDPAVRVILNNRNYGQMRSPTHGIYQAAGKAVIAMCCDFQDPPALIGELIRQWRAGAQIVLGQRRSEPAPWLHRMVRDAGYGFLARHGDYPVLRDVTGFGLFDREVVDMLATWREPEPFFRGMLVESGYRIALLPFDRPARRAGESKNNVRTLLAFALSGLAGSARSLLRLPLILSVYAGLLTLVLAIATIVCLLSGASALFVGLATLQVGLFAILLLFLGLLGDQVRLIAERTRNVPLVIEEQRLNFPADRQRPIR